MQKFTFMLEVTVTDAARCYEAAREKIIEDGREWGELISDEQVAAQIGTAEDPNIAACVEALFEPPTDSPPGTRHQWIPEDDPEGRSPPGSLHGVEPDAA